jgi:hypothetical protein
VLLMVEQQPLVAILVITRVINSEKRLAVAV